MPPRTAKPPAYPPDVDISAIREELELSTFLNKGVLQSNSELKLRIVELERENRTLRLAESALASAEDRLETAEKRVRQLEGELADRERELEERETEVEDKIKDALKAKEGLERENKQLRGMVREWREIGGSFVRRVGGALGLDVGGAGELRRGEQALGTDAEGDDERAAPTQASGERSGLSRPATPPVSAAPSGSRAPEGKLARVVKRDIPRQRTTTRDTSTSASRKQEEDAEHNVPPVRKPVERTYRTRTTGPAPAFLRGDLRDSMGGENAVAGPSSVKRSAPQRPSRACENHTPTPVAKSNHQTSSANNRKRSRIIESQSNEGSEQEDGNLLDDDDGALGHDARPRGSKHPRTAARRVVGQYTVQDEDQVDPMDEESDEEYGQADEDEEGPEVDGEDDGEAATSDNDRAHSPLPAEKRHKTASRISPSRRRPSGSARVESTAIAGSNTRTSRPSQIRSAPRPSDLDTHPSDRHTPSHARTASGGPSSGPSTRVAGSSAKKKPVGESTASRRISTTAHEASSKASHPALASVRDKDRSGYRVKTEPSERVSAKAPAGKDYWGQPIIVKRERISLSPDEPDVAPQGDDGYEYGSDDDPLAGDI